MEARMWKAEVDGEIVYVRAKKQPKWAVVAAKWEPQYRPTGATIKNLGRVVEVDPTKPPLRKLSIVVCERRKDAAAMRDNEPWATGYRSCDINYTKLSDRKVIKLDAIQCDRPSRRELDSCIGGRVHFITPSLKTREEAAA